MYSIIQIHISQAMNFVIIFLLLCSLFVQISTNITAIVLGQLFTLTLGSNIRQRRRAVQFTAVTVPNDAQHDLYNFHDSSARLAPATAFLRRTPSSPPRQPRPSLASSHCSHQKRGKQIVLTDDRPLPSVPACRTGHLIFPVAALSAAGLHSD